MIALDWGIWFSVLLDSQSSIATQSGVPTNIMPDDDDNDMHTKISTNHFFFVQIWHVITFSIQQSSTPKKSSVTFSK